MDCRSFVVGAADHQGRLALAVDLRSSVRNPALESATGVALADEGHGRPRAAAASGAMQMAHAGQPHVQGTGTVNSVDATGHKINLTFHKIGAIDT
jgi:hypothetical protein